MIIDAHMHYADDDPEFQALLAEFDLKFMNICVVEPINGEWREQAALYSSMSKAFPNRFAWCTSFSLPDFIDNSWLDRATAQLDADFADGAIACKVWKNVGMELRKPDGSFVMPDDPIFDPVYEHVAAKNKTLLMHIAEPIACWQPLTGDNPHLGYYRDNPEWHMYNRPEFPSHSQLIEARDQVAIKHPNLRVVGAHLGSLEFDLDLLGERFDKYPNFSADISARLIDLVIQPSAKVREFFLRYPDRLLFGTDVVMHTRPSAMSPEDREAALARLRKNYQTHFAYFNDDKPMSYRNRQTVGLKLPQSALDDFYVNTPKAWYPGL
jgi:hypothetical protein